MTSQTTIWELMLVAIMLLVTFFWCDARLQAPSMPLTMWRILLLSIALLSTAFVRGAWIPICGWTGIIIWGRILYENERFGAKVRAAYEFSSFVWNWKWPPYRPSNFGPY
jgi:hypothetical protein